MTLGHIEKHLVLRGSRERRQRREIEFARLRDFQQRASEINALRPRILHVVDAGASAVSDARWIPEEDAILIFQFIQNAIRCDVTSFAMGNR